MTIPRRLRNVLLAVAGRVGPLPRLLATNLAEISIVYRDGWSVDGSTAVERWAPEYASVSNGPEPTFGLVVPESHEVRALADAAHFPNLPVRVVPASGLSEILLVRPDGYVAGRGAPGEGARLLGLLAWALEAGPRGAAEAFRLPELPVPSNRNVFAGGTSDGPRRPEQRLGAWFEEEVDRGGAHRAAAGRRRGRGRLRLPDGSR